MGQAYLSLFRARFDPDLLEHILTSQGLGDAFSFVLGERMVGIGARNLKHAIVDHYDPERTERHTRRDQDLVYVVDAEAAGLLNPVFKEWVAQSVLGLRFGKIRAFDDETVFAHLDLGVCGVDRTALTLPPYLLVAK